MKNKKQFNQKATKLLGTEREGLLVTVSGANAEIEDENGNLVRCHVRKNANAVITGDRVLWLPEQDGTGSIVGHLPRQSFLCRPENSHRAKAIAANIDTLIIVTTPPPVLSEDMIDRYLIAAEVLQIKPVILLNKKDLLTEKNQDDVEQRLRLYEKIGYSVIYSTTYSQNGLAELKKYLTNKTGVLVGASGVGKSSIISALTELQTISIGEVSQSTGLGKHTTTTTRLYHLPQGGSLIDSPGIREFGLWQVSKEEVLQGFIEFKPYLNQCKFRDCRHDKEPGCAVQKAVADELINARRFLNYRRIVAGL